MLSVASCHAMVACCTALLLLLLAGSVRPSVIRSQPTAQSFTLSCPNETVAEAITAAMEGANQTEEATFTSMRLPAPGFTPRPVTQVDGSEVNDYKERLDSQSNNNVSNTSFSNLFNDSDTSRLQKEIRDRIKQGHLRYYQQMILFRLGMNTLPNVSISPMPQATWLDDMLRNSSSTTAPGNNFTEKTQSFYPSCSVPTNTDQTNWETENKFRLFYDVKLPNPAPGTQTSIVSANLRLYKKASVIYQYDTNSVSDNLTISIYRFVKPVRARGRAKRKLITSHTISAYRKGWIVFNITSVVCSWTHPSLGKNYGLEVEVENSWEYLINPNLYFEHMNCSDNSTYQAYPFPNILLLQSDLAGSENETSPILNKTYPTLDLQTVEIPRMETTPQPPVTTTEAERSKRRRRASHSKERTNKECTKKSSYVTFEELGLDQVLQPEGFNAYYCEGQCRCSDESSASCKEKVFDCQATEYESFNITYLDNESQVTMTTLENFLPKDCTCEST